MDKKEYSIAGFRANLREAFNLAEGEVDVYIDRYGIRYVLITDEFFQELVKTNNLATQHKAIMEAKVPEEGRYVQTPEGVVGPSKLKTKSMGFCKEGHPIPNGRTKCLGKGCKYS